MGAIGSFWRVFRNFSSDGCYRGKWRTLPLVKIDFLAIFPKITLIFKNFLSFSQLRNNTKKHDFPKIAV